MKENYSCRAIISVAICFHIPYDLMAKELRNFSRLEDKSFDISCIKSRFESNNEMKTNQVSRCVRIVLFEEQKRMSHPRDVAPGPCERIAEVPSRCYISVQRT